jgi:ribosomal protein S18 acetylase RimI-like enzyme
MLSTEIEKSSMIDKLRKRVQLSGKEYQLIKQLFTTCERNDGFTPRLYWNCIKNRAPDVNHDYLFFRRDLLIAYLGIFNFTAKEVEVCALVHPLHRQKGLFKYLLKTAMADVNYKVVDHILLSCAKGFPAAAHAFAALGASYKHSEYTLEISSLQNLSIDTTPQAAKPLTVVPITENDVQLVAKLDSECFKSPLHEGLLRFGQTLSNADREAYFANVDDETVGKIHIHFFENKAFIHDFCIAPEHQGKKFGRDLLVHTLSLLKNEKRRGVELDVIASNEQAINLYLKNGFELKHAYDYWELQPSLVGASSNS